MCLIAIISWCHGQGESKVVKPQTSLAPFIGSWAMSEVHWVTKDTTYSIHQAQPGIFIFTPISYAIMWTPTESPRQAFADLANPSEDEMQKAFKSIVFNAGDFIWTDSTITTQATIAKVPGIEGGRQYYRYSLNGDVLQLTMYDETYPNGDKPAWSGKYQTVFVLKRIE